MDADVIIVGGGMVGASLAYGVARQGKSVLVLDGADRDRRAARSNFGLVWLQGKGLDFPPYMDLTQQSIDQWPQFIADLQDISDIRVDYERPGGLTFCLGEKELSSRAAVCSKSRNIRPEVDIEMIDRRLLETMFPKITFGAEVIGASYAPTDGHTNPLQLLAGLHRAIPALGSRILYRSKVDSIIPSADGFIVSANNQCFCAEKVIIAAGVESPDLTKGLDLDIPMRANRGQLLVTERLDQILPFPASGLRQTHQGTIMIGATNEETMDRGVTSNSAMRLASRAARIIPALSRVNIVRQWSGFRVLPHDGAPIYAESRTYPGLYAALCHSGVTLAAAHASIVGPAITNGQLQQDLAAFSNGRFDVQKCA